jgi:hypothetical protein
LAKAPPEQVAVVVTTIRATEKGKGVLIYSPAITGAMPI